MKILKPILAVIFITLALFVIRTLYLGGVFRSLTEVSLKEVEKVALPGVEDITIDQETGIAFLSSSDRWASLAGNPEQGGIYSLDLNKGSLTPKLLTKAFTNEFHPHGISFRKAADGRKYLFVINHPGDRDIIEKFEFRNDSLFHLHSYEDKLIISPNDILAIDESRFYFTNDHNEPASAARGNKDILGIKTGELIYFDGQSFHPTGIEGLGYANGVNVSNDGKRLYLAATTERHLYVFDRDPESGRLSFSDKVNCSSGVDNIEIDVDDSIWIGAHPKTLKFLGHTKGSENLSPSEIIMMRDNRNGNFPMETVYLNNGAEISGSAVGAPYGDQLLIGPVFAHHFLRAKMK